jgi:tetratricopeptide (TPR) repeat protein
MPTLFEFSQHINTLKKEKKYTDAITYFRLNKGGFSKEQIGTNEYLVSDIISCLRYSNHIDAGFQFLTIYGVLINEFQKERVLSAYGWLLWAKYKSEMEKNGQILSDEDYFVEEDDEIEIKDYDFDKSELLQRVEILIPILNSFTGDFTKTLASNLFNIVLKSEKKNPAPNWRLINEFCNRIDKENLSKNCSTIKVERKGQLKDMELASDFENWYAYKTKALSKLGEWQECFELSKEALEKIDNFHYSNDIWFSRRVALSKRNLGNTEDTIQELQNILKKKREWFIQKELAELYFEKGNIDLSLKHATDAINNFGPLEFKVDLLYLLGKILRQQDKLELSFQHFSLSKLIRQSEEWKIPQKLLSELESMEFQEIPQSDLRKLKVLLQKYWDSFKDIPAQRFVDLKSFDGSKTIGSGNFEGEIIRLLHDNDRGKVGFVKSNGKEYYFSVNQNYPHISKIFVGTKVIFEVKPSAEGKRDQTRIKKIIE